ncbi:hypothetical protein G7Y31_02980 [Corynebacterium lizhenjunii]|uniref:DNA-directed RNA polymerase II n=1 Tax=Corynebacterium lizhenjunii TaxID=2709394 RepID=A0A7T0KF80_9CORY|nr:hypothetical protein [Corynebacterium lizhenjunii]QPK79685.1 hypothetical protein G7Y31_02980 [Corynebacterium lizhenjunii]
MKADTRRVLIFIAVGVLVACAVGTGVWRLGTPGSSTSDSATNQAHGVVVTHTTSRPASVGDFVRPTEDTDSPKSGRTVALASDDPFLPPNAAFNTTKADSQPTTFYRPPNISGSREDAVSADAPATAANAPTAAAGPANTPGSPQAPQAPQRPGQTGPRPESPTPGQPERPAPGTKTSAETPPDTTRPQRPDATTEPDTSSASTPGSTQGSSTGPTTEEPSTTGPSTTSEPTVPAEPTEEESDTPLLESDGSQDDQESTTSTLATTIEPDPTEPEPAP